MEYRRPILSKLTIFLIFILLIPINESCTKNQREIIPYVLVDFTISLTDPIFLGLNAVGNHALVNSSTNNMGIYAAGYDGNGIIIYRAQLDEFYAFDRTCPHDYALSGSSIAVELEAGEIFATCPSCGSKYALPSFGTPSEGPSKYPLKIYRTSLFGEFVRVYN